MVGVLRAHRRSRHTQEVGITELHFLPLTSSGNDVLGWNASTASARLFAGSTTMHAV